MRNKILNNLEVITMEKTLDETKVVETEETMEIEPVEEVVEESKFKKVGKKLLTGAKKHGKKVLAGAALLALGFAGGKMTNGKSDDEDYYDDNGMSVDAVDVDFVEVEETTTV
jgi:hypothetical protein